MAAADPACEIRDAGFDGAGVRFIDPDFAGEVTSNKTDCDDARGIARMMRAGLYRPVRVKTLRNQKLRMLLTHRKLARAKHAARLG